MSSMQWQLGVLGTISAFALTNTGKPRKTCAEIAGRRTSRILTSSRQAGKYSMYDSNTHTVTQYT